MKAVSPTADDDIEVVATNADGFVRGRETLDQPVALKIFTGDVAEFREMQLLLRSMGKDAEKISSVRSRMALMLNGLSAPELSLMKFIDLTAAPARPDYDYLENGDSSADGAGWAGCRDMWRLLDRSTVLIACWTRCAPCR